ncbi:SDR family oxidoreductase [Rhizohabitans arisaemae]|uniref:SDR family oxidoreductase n=1 Tax=Rhizohabitans arisaemae TaxID=2720610 RepID=UPI0024B2722F|nr:NAD(P)H-binding protein [Rhizohabitans arisaemae]
MTILVTGATGVVGRRVVAELLQEGRAVRALTRRPAAATLPGEVDVREGDLERPESLQPALKGVERLYLFPMPETAAEIVAMAVESGVRRIVVLSGASATEEEFGSGYLAVEQAVSRSGVDWTHVRPGEFAGNWLDWGPKIRAERVVRRPYGEAVTQPTHESDVAAVAAAALLRDGHTGRTYTFAGPQALTVREQVSAIAAAIGSPVRFEEQDPIPARDLWIQEGYPAEVVDWLFGMWRESAENPLPVNEQWASVVPDITGRPARTFAEWAVENAAAFR